MKIYLAILFLISSISNIVFSQSIGKMQFKDFPVVQNLDSLEQAINIEQTNPEKQLIGLLTLEKSRLALASYKFGSSMPTLKPLVQQFQFPSINGIYLFFLGNLSKTPQECFKQVSDALSIFESQKDTTGIITCIRYLIRMNISGFSNVVGDLAVAEKNLTKIRDLDSYSKEVNNHILVLRTSIYFYFHDLSKYADSTTYCLEKAFELIKLYPEYGYMKSEFLNYQANLYHFKKDYARSKQFHLEAINCIPTTQSIRAAEYHYNLGNDYVSLEDPVNAEKNYLEGIRLNKLISKDTMMFINLYNNLSMVQFDQLKNYKAAWLNMDTADTYKKIRQDTLNRRMFLDLQTKYETDKKDQANLVLQKEKRQYQMAILFGILLLATISLLLFYLFRKNKQLDAYAHFRDQIFTIISHDLRSPVMALEGLSKQASFLIKRGELNSLQLVSQKIDTSVLQMNGLLNNLLAWAISQNVEMAAKMESFLLLPLVDEIVALYAEVANAKQVAIEINIPHNLLVNANKNGMAVIIRNLLDNAIKYAASKEITVSAVLEENKLVLKVSNNDVIAATETIERIQNQLNGTSANYMQTTSGFGLNLISYFSKLHKGSVDLKSDITNGTVFTVYLPQ